MKYKMEEMFPDEFLAAVDRAPVFILPTGLMEWHGDHLPLGQDTMKSYGICQEVAKAGPEGLWKSLKEAELPGMVPCTQWYMSMPGSFRPGAHLSL